MSYLGVAYQTKATAPSLYYLEEHPDAPCILSGGKGPDEGISEAEGLSRKLAIVTNEFHAYRASAIVKKLSLSHSSIPAKTPLWLFPTYYLRELFGVMYEWVF